MRRILSLPVVPLLIVAACSAEEPEPVPEPTEDVVLLVTSGGGRLTSWDFGAVVPSTTSTALGLTLTNDGRRVTGALHVALSGSDAAQFAVTEDCENVALAPRGTCSLRVRFLPTSVGSKSATLRVAEARGVAIELALTGTGRATLLAFTPAVFDAGLVAIGDEAITDVTVQNAGTTAITGVAAEVTGPAFTLASTTCTGTLAASATCIARVRFAPDALGLADGTLSVRGAEDLASLALVGGGGRRITVTTTGAGTITSTPAGIDCGTACTGLFTGDVELRAAAGADAVFGAWTAGPCAGSTAAVCAVPAGTAAVTAAARFDVDNTIEVTIDRAGDGLGELDYAIDFGTWQPCASHCVVPVTSGQNVSLRAVSPSVFTGWSGACSGTNPECELTVTADRQVTATFAKDPGELLTRFVTFPAYHITYAPSGDLIGIGGSSSGTVVSRATGDAATVIWSRELPSSAGLGVAGFDTDSAGNVFVLLGNKQSSTTPLQLHKVTAAGAVAWTRVLTGTRFGEQESFPDNLAVTTTDDVAVLANLAVFSDVQLHDGDGTATTPPLWTRRAPRYAYGVAAGPTGGVLLAVEDESSPDNAEVLPITAAGDVLASLGRLPGGYETSLTSDSTGAPVAATSGHSRYAVSQGLGTLTFDTTDSHAYTSHGVAVDGTDHVAAIRYASDSSFPPGFVFHWFLPDGALRIRKPAVRIGWSDYGVWPSSVAAHGNRAAFSGLWISPTGSRQIVRIYQAP